MLTRVMTGAVLAALSLDAGGARAQDPVPIYPDNYKVLFENERVRVIDFVLRKGDTEQFHSHRPHVAYILTGFKIRFTFPDGTSKIRETRAGDVLWSEAVTHSPVNIGDTDAHGIMFEFKEEAQALGAGAGRTYVDRNADLLTAVTFITGKVGLEEDIKAELLKTTEPTRAEARNYRYDLFQNPARPNEFLRIEVWQDAQALEDHKQTPHLKASFAKRREQGWMTNITTWRRVRDW